MSPSSGWSQFMTSLLEGSPWSDTGVCFDTANLLSFLLLSCCSPGNRGESMGNGGPLP